MVDLTNYSLFSFSLTSLCHKTQWKTFAPFSPWSQHLPCSFLPLSPCSLISVLPPLLLWSLMHINASTYVELWKLVPWSLWFSTSNQCLESCTSSCFQNLECLLTVLVLAKAHSSFQILQPTQPSKMIISHSQLITSWTPTPLEFSIVISPTNAYFWVMRFYNNL